MRKKLVAIVVASVVVLGVVGLVAVTTPPPGNQPNLRAILLDAIGRAGDGGTIDLADVVDGDWDTVQFFGGYASYDRIGAALGFDWTPQSQLEHALGFTTYVDEPDMLLVFTKGKSVVAWSMFHAWAERPAINGLDEVSGGVLSRADARFVVKDTSSAAEGKGSSWELTPVSAAPGA